MDGDIIIVLQAHVIEKGLSEVYNIELRRHEEANQIVLVDPNRRRPNQRFEVGPTWNSVNVPLTMITTYSFLSPGSLTRNTLAVGFNSEEDRNTMTDFFQTMYTNNNQTEAGNEDHWAKNLNHYHHHRGQDESIKRDTENHIFPLQGRVIKNRPGLAFRERTGYLFPTKADIPSEQWAIFFESDKGGDDRLHFRDNMRTGVARVRPLLIAEKLNYDPISSFPLPSNPFRCNDPVEHPAHTMVEFEDSRDNDY